MRNREDYLEWEKVKEFEEQGLVVTVLILKTEKPKYNLEVGFRTHQQKVIRRLPLTFMGQGQPTLKRIDTAALGRLVVAAEDYALAEIQKLEGARRDQRVEQSVQQVTKDLQRGQTGPRTPLGIKSLGKLDKAKREAREAEVKAEPPKEG
jgi:hypothetical protein